MMSFVRTAAFGVSMLWGSSMCAANLVVSVSDAVLGLGETRRVEVHAESSDPSIPQTIDNYSLVIRLTPQPASFIAGSAVILNDGQTRTTRDTDTSHLFAGTTPALFDALVASDGSSIAIVDSTGFFDPSAILSERKLLAAFNVSSDPNRPLVGGESFTIDIDATQSTFFDATFNPIASTGIEFRSGLLSVSSVPEPNTFVMCTAMTVYFLRRRRRSVSFQP